MRSVNMTIYDVLWCYWRTCKQNHGFARIGSTCGVLEPNHRYWENEMFFVRDVSTEKHEEMHLCRNTGPWVEGWDCEGRRRSEGGREIREGLRVLPHAVVQGRDGRKAPRIDGCGSILRGPMRLRCLNTIKCITGWSHFCSLLGESFVQWTRKKRGGLRRLRESRRTALYCGPEVQSDRDLGLFRRGLHDRFSRQIWATERRTHRSCYRCLLQVDDYAFWPFFCKFADVFWKKACQGR